MYLDSLGRIQISPASERRKNIFEAQSRQFRLKRFVSSGGSSFVFEIEDLNRNAPNSAIKICRFPVDNISGAPEQRLNRFEREITAISELNKANHPHVIRMNLHDRLTIESKTFRYYTMEMADYTLRAFIQGNQYGIQARVELCLQVLEGIKELHSMGYYHRDIKPDNILFVNNVWKIGDLGLVAKRHEDQTIDEPNEMIGPIGWLSPEAMNKRLTEGKDVGFKYDCRIDEFSDIFQLGKLFWFIFQCNVPIGQLKRGDFKRTDDAIFQLLELMLQHDKERRPTLDRIFDAFQPIAKTHAVI